MCLGIRRSGEVTTSSWVEAIMDIAEEFAGAKGFTSKYVHSLCADPTVVADKLEEVLRDRE